MLIRNLCQLNLRQKFVLLARSGLVFDTLFSCVKRLHVLDELLSMRRLMRMLNLKWLAESVPFLCTDISILVMSIDLEAVGYG